MHDDHAPNIVGASSDVMRPWSTEQGNSPGSFFWLGLPALVVTHAALTIVALSTAGGLATGRRPVAAEADEQDAHERLSGAVGEVEPSLTSALRSGDEDAEARPDDPAHLLDDAAPAFDGGSPVEGSEPAVTADEIKERPTRDRARRRQRAAEAVVASVDDEPADDRNAALMPLVRHMSSLTKELAEAHRTIGRMSAERDALQRELAEIKGLPVPEPDDGMPRPNKEARIEAKAAKQAERSGIVPAAEIEPELAHRAEAVGRRRRMIALGVVFGLASTIALLQIIGIDIPWSDMSKDGLRGLDYVGPFIMLMMTGFMFYRIVRMGGKAGRWLFPEPEQPRRRRR